MPDLTPPPAKASGDAGHIAVHETLRQAVIALDGHGHPTSEVTGLDAALAGKAASSHTHTTANVTGLDAALAAKADAAATTSALAGKAATSHAHATTDITALAEFVRDTIGATLVAGSNITVTVDDTADTITIGATGGVGGGLDDAGVAALFSSGTATREAFEDRLSSVLVGGANASVTYDDATSTITIAVTGLGDAASRNVGTSSGTVAAGDHTHGGYSTTGHTHVASSVTDLGNAATKSTGTTAGTVAAGDDSRITGAAQKASNLSDLASASTARTNLGLGDAATKSTGTAAGTVAAGDHTHTAANVSDFAEVARDTLAAALVAGSGITITPNDGADTITIAASGGGSGGKVVFTYSVDGELATGVGAHRIFNDSGSTLTISKIRATVGTAPTGADILIDVNINGTTIWSTQSNRVTIAAGATTGTQTTFNTATITDGQSFSVDIDQVGSATKGNNLVVTIWAS